MDLSPYAVEVDLDNDIVSIGMQAPRIPDLPPRGKAKLLAALAEHAKLSYCRMPSAYYFIYCSTLFVIVQYSGVLHRYYITFVIINGCCDESSR